MLLGGYLGGSQGAELGGQALGQLASTGAAAYVQGYSREQEFEADQLGIRYLGRAGYDPGAMGELPRHAAGRRRLPPADAGRRDGGGELSSATGSAAIRARRTGWRGRPRQRAAELPGARETDRPELLTAIDGML